jgi:hypothetical protein
VLDITLEVSLHMPQPAMQVHEFMTTPDNWVGASPVTTAVRGEHTDRPAILGERFVDVLALGPDATVEVEWTVTREEPGVVWQIATDLPAGADPAAGSVHVTITYAYAYADAIAADAADAAGTTGGTLVTRTVRGTYPGTAPLPLAYRDSLTNADVANHFLASMRAALPTFTGRW